MSRRSLFLVTIVVEGGLYLFGLLLMGGSEAVWSHFNFSWSATAYAFLLCLPMLAVLYFTVRSKWTTLSRFRNEIDQNIVPIFANYRPVDFALIALLAGVGEEIFFRGWLQSALSAKFGVVLGILTASLIFGLAHYLSFTYAIYAGLTGVYLGMIYYVTGSLYIVMTIHAVYDFIALIYLIRRKKSKVEFQTVSDGDGI